MPPIAAAVKGAAKKGADAVKEGAAAAKKSSGGGLDYLQENIEFITGWFLCWAWGAIIGFSETIVVSLLIVFALTIYWLLTKIFPQWGWCELGAEWPWSFGTIKDVMGWLELIFLLTMDILLAAALLTAIVFTMLYLQCGTNIFSATYCAFEALFAYMRS